MAKSKTSARSKNRYAAKAYDGLRIIVPKGRKADIQRRANELQCKGYNTFVCELIRDALGMSVDEWKAAPSDTSKE